MTEYVDIDEKIRRAFSQPRAEGGSGRRNPASDAARRFYDLSSTQRSDRVRHELQNALEQLTERHLQAAVRADTGDERRQARHAFTQHWRDVLAAAAQAFGKDNVASALQGMGRSDDRDYVLFDVESD